MGIYSTEAANLLKEDFVNPDAAGLLEFAINSQRSEQAMFQTMLEMDILEYRCESGDVVLTEEEKENGLVAGAKALGQKIVATIEHLIETLSKFVTNCLNFIKSRILSDKKIVSKYKDHIDLAAAKANKPDAKAAPIINISKAGNIKSAIEDFTKSYDKIVANAEKFGKENDAGHYKDVNLDNFKDRVAGITNSLNDYFDPKSTISDLTNEDIAIAKKYVEGAKGYEELADAIILKATDDTIKKLKETKKALLKSVTKIGKNENRAADAQKFKIVTNLNSNISKLTNFGTRVAMTAMKNVRLNYVAVATAAMAGKKSEEEAKQESADYNEIFNYAFEIATENAYDEITFA